MRVLITGGAGFIGSSLSRRLTQSGHSVVVVDNLSTGSKTNVPSEADFVLLDMTNKDFTHALPAGPYDAVCHLAAQSSGPASSDMPYYDLEANAASTLLLSRWCLQQRVPHFLYASSMAVYGNSNPSPVKESASCYPVSYYGVSKLMSEHLLRVASQEGLRSTSFRLFSVYGPGQNLANLKQGMISIYMAYMLQAQTVPVTGSLDRFRDFTFIDDVIDAWIAAIERPAAASAVYNIGGGRPTTVRELLESLRAHFKGLPGPYFQEVAGHASDQFGLYADIQSVAKELGWKPRTTLSEGLQRMVTWARAQ